MRGVVLLLIASISCATESPSAPVSALAAWYQPGALNLLVGLEDGTLQALLVPRDGLTEAAETGIPAGVAPGAAAAPLDCRSPCSIRALRLIGNAKRRRGRDGVLPGGPVLVSAGGRGSPRGPALAARQPLAAVLAAVLSRGGRLPDSEGGMGVLLEGSASGHVAVALAGQTLAIFCLAQPQGPALPRGQGLAAGAVQILQGIGMVAVVAVVLVRAHARRKHRVESVPSVERLKAFEAMLADPKTGGRGGAGQAGSQSGHIGERTAPPLRGRADTASFENLGGSEDDNDASVHMLLSELDVEVLEEG
ncbi:hypothetical protein APUTEX25_003857 [Auxenochlorella protothecoides]|uniref:Uncharacterized protein n=1 Tax=Auxenochlorella protothecoides TaxID=3075 RepID=A0A3M7KZI4_AUXPR|nr:hypothetical protein APUTEX25_003857 [Auxenochlorella protothecoides]|eukprot:RMZ55891.1 hypothetical protein APUTEX25_003857 [Auxenochlorella protothecoides]